jgi:hypothetical protein
MKILFTILSFIIVQTLFAQSDSSSLFHIGTDTVPDYPKLFVADIKWDTSFRFQTRGNWWLFHFNTDTIISKAEFNRNQALYLAVCNILQYITANGKITDKKAFAAAVKFYLEYLKQNHLP